VIKPYQVLATYTLATLNHVIVRAYGSNEALLNISFKNAILRLFIAGRSHFFRNTLNASDSTEPVTKTADASAARKVAVGSKPNSFMCWSVSHRMTAFDPGPLGTTKSIPMLPTRTKPGTKKPEIEKKGGLISTGVLAIEDIDHSATGRSAVDIFQDRCARACFL
jgi:hypothetical protein